MVSGWDKRPPEYHPDIGWTGRIILLAFLAFVILAVLGPVFL